MDTSVGARYVAIALVFAAGCSVVYANFRLVAFLALRRRVGRAAKVIWPLLLLAMIFCIFDAVRIEPDWLQVTRHTITTSKLPAGSRLRIVHLTDIHLERTGARERRMVDLVRRARPDIIVLTGDQTQVDDPTTLRQLTEITTRLVRIAPVYAIEGNWDSDESMAAVELGGGRVLRDWTIVRGRRGARIALDCLAWNGGSLSPPPRQAEPLFKAVLCHMPDQFPMVADAGIDLMLAGHTHGGQIRLPIFGALLPVRSLVGRYQAGIYRRGDSRLYVSRGIGMEGGSAPKVRFCCRPEVAVIDVIGESE